MHPTMLRQGSRVWCGLAALAVIASAPVAAKPPAAHVLCQTYPDSPLCVGRTVSCSACHTAAPLLNPYGDAVEVALINDGYEFFPDQEETDFVVRLRRLLPTLDRDDSDRDGISNLEELSLGTMPGDAQSHFVAPAVEGSWDPRFAYRRAKVAFCGEPPTYDEMATVPTDESGGRMAVQTLLDTCLASDFWRNEALHRMADRRIRPQHAVGYDLGNAFALADYRYDYRLFSYAMSGNRDVRDLLLGTYHIGPSGDRVEGAFNVAGEGGALGQPLAPAQRAGMISTAWYLAIHTMFADLPRTAAAQAYRAYLGEDISLSEGLRPVEGEPVDVDGKGVTGRTCNVCHSTLDPLSYAFAAYEGIQGGATGTFSAARLRRVRGTSTTHASILGTNLDTNPAYNPATVGLRGWATVATQDVGFARTVVFMLAEHALGRTPTPQDTLELLPLVERLRGMHAFRAEASVRDIVNSDAFGRP
jgi:hypothetical protein